MSLYLSLSVVILYLSLVLHMLLNHFYGPQDHFYDCFPTGFIHVYMYYLLHIIYIIIYLCHIHVHIAYIHVRVVNEVVSFRGLGELMGVVHQQMHD